MTPLVSIQDLVKHYQALRPLRIKTLTVSEGDVVSLFGLDAQAAEVLVGVLTGALVPDEGEVRLFDRSTKEIGDAEAWLAMLDGVGLLTPCPSRSRSIPCLRVSRRRWRRLRRK
jgi:ABC-type sugar transport system ATPase subunit